MYDLPCLIHSALVNHSRDHKLTHVLSLTDSTKHPHVIFHHKSPAAIDGLKVLDKDVHRMQT